LGIVEIEIVNNNKLLTQIKQSIHAVEQNADIILYGSRSRGDSVSDSDWDLLILVDGDVNDERIDKIRYQLYEVEWEYTKSQRLEQQHLSNYAVAPENRTGRISHLTEWNKELVIPIFLNFKI